MNSKRIWQVITLLTTLSGMLCVILTAQVLSIPLEGKQANFYVATNGNDAWSGKLSEPNSGKTDGSFATLERARDAIRELKTSGNLRLTAGHSFLKMPITIMVRGGDYYRTEPFVLLPEDSGTKECPVIYTAYPEEKPVINGGRRITGWKRGKKGLWMAEVPEVKTGTLTIRQLFINGKRSRRARTPNEGILKLTGSAEPALKAFQFNPGDIKNKWTNLADVEIVILQHWMESRLLIDRIDEMKNTVWFTGGSWRSLAWSTGYYVDNVYEGLDEPGEWYLNRKTGIVYYLPQQGDDMKTAEFIAPVANQLVRFEGDVDSGKYVQYVTLSGLTFAFTNWTMPEKGYSYPQAELSWPQPAEEKIHPQAQAYVGSALYANGMRHCCLENNDIAHLGTWGIELWQGCKDNRIVGNHLYDIGAGGIKIGEPVNAETDELETSHTTISDNLIHDGCRVYLGAPAVWIGQSSNNTVSHNEIYGRWQWAISVGWNWAYMPPNRARDNSIEYNNCHHIGDSELGSHAIIYSLGVQPGTVIRYNLVHHMLGKGHGICLDNGSGGVLVEYNIVHHGIRGGWVGNYNNIGSIVQNNIFAFGKETQMIRHGDRPPKGQKVDQTGFFYRNIFYWYDDILFQGNEWTNYDIIMDYNLYYDASGKPVKFLSFTFDEWKAKGLDVHSQIADPLFVDPENGDFTLKPESPAFKLGFQPIDLSSIGPRK